MMNSMISKLLNALTNHSITAEVESVNDELLVVLLEKEGIEYSLSLTTDNALVQRSVYRFDIGYDWEDLLDVDNYDLALLCQTISNMFDEEISNLELENEYMKSLENEENN